MPTTYAIPDGRVAMAATTYTGNGTSQVVSNAVNGVGMQPDLIWGKNRGAAVANRLTDSVRGITKVLYSDQTAVEGTESTNITTLNSNGYTAGAGNLNTNAASFVAWQWKAGGTAVSNTAGSITSQVSANTTAGFSVVTYTGTGANATVGHGLGVAPSMVIARRRNGSSNWVCWHSAFAGTQQILLNDTGAISTDATAWNSTVPSSTVISVGNNGYTNASTGLQIAYCFAPVAGYSAMGSYTGNGSTDGVFVYLGFRARWLMVKRTDASADWIIFDTSRNTYNLTNLELNANLSGAEFDTAAFRPIDILSNGFKLRGSNGGGNASGGTYIYMAFAEVPFKFANSR